MSAKWERAAVYYTRMRAQLSPVRLLIVGFAVLSFAQFAVTTALAIYGFTAAGALGAGLASARVLPSVLAGVLGGRLAARARPGLVLVVGNTLEVLAIGAMAVALFAGASFAFVLALSMVDAVVMMVYRPAQARLLPALVRTPSELTAGATSLTNAKGISQIPGTLAGGLLIAAMGPATTFLIAAVVIAFASVVVIPVARRARAVDERDKPAGARERQQSRLDAGVIRVMAVSGIRTFVRGLWLPLTTVVALDMMGLGESAVGIMMAAAGIGTLVAVPASRLLVGRRSLLAPLAGALVLCGVPLILIAAVPVPTVALGLLVIWGVGTAFADSTINSLLFRLVAGRQIAQVVGSLESLRLALGGLGALAAPLLISLFGVRGAILCAGAVPLVLLAAEWHGLRAVDGIAGRRVERIERLGGVPLFNSLRVDALEQAAASLVAVQMPAGADVIRQDDPDSRRWFLVEDGTADVLVDGWLVGTLGPGCSFGEKGLLRSVPRAATVRARTPLRLQALDRAAFLAAATGDPTGGAAQPEGESSEARREPAELLEVVPLLTGLEAQALQELAALGSERTVSAGQDIVREGDAADSLYVLLEGEAAVYSGERHIRTLAPSDHFGEIGLLHGVPRTASVRCVTDLRLFSIDRETLLQARPDGLALANVA